MTNTTRHNAADGNSGETDQLTPPSRPRVRLISALDALGTRYLSADVQVVRHFGCWALPFALGTVDALGEPMPGTPEAAIEVQLQYLSKIDRGGRSDAERVVVKSGYLCSAGRIDAVAEYLQDLKPRLYVLDPELFDSNGRPRTSARAVNSVRRKLLKSCQATVVNRHEAAALTGRDVEGMPSMREACRALYDFGAEAVVVTGGQLDRFPIDLLYDGTGYEELGADRVRINGRIRGAGGIFSSAFAALLAQGDTSPVEAGFRAREAVTAALKQRVLLHRNGVWSVRDLEGASMPGASDAIWVANPLAIGQS